MLADQIVQEGGLEYATDVIIHSTEISEIKMGSARNNVIILSSGIAPSYLEQYSRFELRLRKHLSLTKSLLAKMCTKLIAAIPHIPEWRQPLIALLLPENQKLHR